jgi:hypothetical protein
LRRKKSIDSNSGLVPGASPPGDSDLQEIAAPQRDWRGFRMAPIKL